MHKKENIKLSKMPKLSKTVDDFGFLLYGVINKWIHYHISNIIKMKGEGMI